MNQSKQVPPAPRLVPHTNWPFPGMTPEDSARATMAGSMAYIAMLAAVIKSNGGHRITDKQVLSLVPHDWRELCGRFAHGHISCSQGSLLGIESHYVHHDGGGFHFEYNANTA